MSSILFLQKMKSQSRIDKWKAKHEAMLKLATGNGEEEKDDGSDSKSASNGHDTEVDVVNEDDSTKKDSKGKPDSEPELPSIESGGVCIDIPVAESDEKKEADDGAAGKPHTRHSAALQQQQKQALSV